MKNLYKDGVKSVSEGFSNKSNPKKAMRNTYGSVDYNKKLAATRATGKNPHGNKPSTYPGGTSGVKQTGYEKQQYADSLSLYNTGVKNEEFFKKNVAPKLAEKSKLKTGLAEREMKAQLAKSHQESDAALKRLKPQPQGYKPSGSITSDRDSRFAINTYKKPTGRGDVKIPLKISDGTVKGKKGGWYKDPVTGRPIPAPVAEATTYRNGTAGVGFGKAAGIMGGLGMLGTMAGIATGNEKLGNLGATVNNLGGIASGISSGYENRNRVYKMGTKGVRKKNRRC
jgi:hypothetical protein